MGEACSTCRGEERYSIYRGFWCGNLREGDHLEDPGVDGSNIKIDFQEVGWRELVELIWMRIGQVAGSYKCGNSPSGSVKCREFLD